MINRQLIIQALIENDHLMDFWGWKLHNGKDGEIVKSVNNYNKYINEEYRKLDLKGEDVITLIKHMHKSIEQFIIDNAFIGQFAVFGTCDAQYNNDAFIEFLDINEVCDRCEDHIDNCTCEEVE